MLKSRGGEQITAGFQGDSNVNVGAWFGSTYQQALEDEAKIVLRKDGTGYIGNAEITNDGDIRVLGGISEVIITPSTMLQALSKKSNFDYKEDSLSVLVSGSSRYIRRQSTTDLTWSDAYNANNNPAYVTLPAECITPTNYRISFNARFVVRFSGFASEDPSAGFITVNNAAIRFGAITSGAKTLVDGGTTPYYSEVPMTFGFNSNTGKYECSGACQFQANPVNFSAGEKVRFAFDVKFTVNFSIYRSEIYIDGYFL